MHKRLVPTLLLIAYSALLVKVMVFKDVPLIRIGQLMLNFGGTDGGHPANYVPFTTILPYLFGYKGLIIAGINLIGNIALLVPLGFLLPFVYRKMTWKKSLVLGVVAGLAIEMMQTILHVGIFDIDDVILNAFGVMTGYWTFAILARWVRGRRYKTIVAAVLLCVAIAAAALYAIYPKNEVVRPDIRAGEDLCGGTGGTGEIVGTGNSGITIKRNDGTTQEIGISNKTTIRSSMGSISASDLKVGDRVTIVIYDDITADAVMVCNTVDAH